MESQDSTYLYETLSVVAILFGSGNLGGGGNSFEGNPRSFPLKKIISPMRKTVHVTCMFQPSTCM